MERLNPVQQKVSCIFNICVKNEASDKRSNQAYKVVAGDKLNSRLTDGELNGAHVTEKLDGTCVLIEKFQGKPWLWARLDRKPSKGAEKRFKKFQSQNQFSEDLREEDKPKFNWDIQKDFKEVPDNWIPASGVEKQDGHPIPDSIGHTPGWVPVDINSRQYCWHLTSVDLLNGLALVLTESKEDRELVIDCVKLESLVGHTAELIGTMINANPYKIGNKQCPIHLLVVHGSIEISSLPHIDRQELLDWFQCHENGQLEGIVWHCTSGRLYKLHRNHLGLKWPVEDLMLSKRCVQVSNNFTQYELCEDTKSLFTLFSSVADTKCDALQDIHKQFADKNT